VAHAEVQGLRVLGSRLNPMILVVANQVERKKKRTCDRPYGKQYMERIVVRSGHPGLPEHAREIK
jgi:hypothetical protein